MDFKNQHTPIPNFNSENGLHRSEKKEVTIPAPRIFPSSRSKLLEITGIKYKPRIKFKPVRLLHKDLSPGLSQESDNESDKENDKQKDAMEEERKCEKPKSVVSKGHDLNLDSQKNTENNELNSNVKSQGSQPSDTELSENCSLPTGIFWINTPNPKTKSTNQMGLFPVSSVKNTPTQLVINTVCKNGNMKTPSLTNPSKENSSSYSMNSYLKPTPLKGSILDNILEDSDLLSTKVPNDSIILRQQFFKQHKQSNPQSEIKNHHKSYTTPFKNHSGFNYWSFKSREKSQDKSNVNNEHKNINEKLSNQCNINTETKNINRPLFNNTDSKSEQNIKKCVHKFTLNNNDTNTNPVVINEQKNNIAQSAVTDSHLKPLVTNIQVQIPKHDAQDCLWNNDPIFDDKKDKHVEIINVISSFPLSAEHHRKYQSIFIKGEEYSILNKVGDGGSCEVYQIFDFKNSQLKALKIVNLAVDRITAQGYINEVKLLSKLQGSDCVIKMYDYEILQEEKRLLVVMERGDIDLAKLLRNTAVNRSQLPLPIIIFYWTEMLTAVKYIHDNGIIHSDLKPGNFLLVMGRLKLIDFGIASVLDDNMTSVIKSTQTGTFNYISPEALIDSQVNNPGSPLKNVPKIKMSYKSDVWSLGCILYNLVYRRTPFQHITKSWLKMEAITDPTYQISYPEVSHCSEIIMETMKKCLTYEVKKRPTVNELLSIKYI